MSENATTAGERQVLAEAPSGELADLGELADEQRVVSPDVIRRLCVGLEAKDVDPRGIRIKHARIVELLDLSFCTIRHPLRFEATTFDAVPDLSGTQLPALWIIESSLPGLRANGVRIDDLRLGLSEVRGEVSLLNAKVGVQVNCAGATLTNESGYALLADGAEINGDVSLSDGFRANGAVRLPGAKIGGLLDCEGATLTNKGVALSADGAEINGGVFLRDGFSATGEVRLVNAKIGLLDCAGATLTNEGAALSADGAEINGGVFLRDGFSATGEVRLVNAKIGLLDCARATLTKEGDEAVALYAERTEISGSVFLRDEFSATGEVRFVGAKIGGQLRCSNATLVNRAGTGLALGARYAAINTALVFRNVRVTGGVDLFRASAATLEDDLGRADQPLGSWLAVQPLLLDGFAYARFGLKATWDSKTRRDWLKQTSGFEQGAWQHLIEVYRAQGRDDEATKASIAMHNDRVARADLPWYRKWGRRYVLRPVLGHGYRPWLVAIPATLIIAGFAVVVWHWSGMFDPDQGVVGSPQPVGYAADAFLPIIDLGQADSWTPTGGLRWVEWLVILLGWTLSTIFVAGFTRAVRSE